MDTETSRNLAEPRFDRSLIHWVMQRIGNPRISVRMWNGDEFPITDERPIACMEIRERRAIFEMLRSPSLGFGESYSRGLIEIHGDLLAFSNEVTAAITHKRASGYYGPKLRSLLYAMNRNSLARSQRNVHHHYDLGNDFYKLWLDERMVYTCAYYDTPSVTLAEAQVAKLDHVCRKLRLQPGQKVIEAGCGWGALAMHMAEHYGVDVIAYNRSKEQVAYARESYELFFDGKRVGHEGAWTIEQAIENLRGNRSSKPQIRVEGRYDGELMLWAEPTGYELFFNGIRVGHEPGWTKEQGLANLRFNLKANAKQHVRARFEGVELRLER